MSYCLERFYGYNDPHYAPNIFIADNLPKDMYLIRRVGISTGKEGFAQFLASFSNLPKNYQIVEAESIGLRYKNPNYGSTAGCYCAICPTKDAINE